MQNWEVEDSFGKNAEGVQEQEHVDEKSFAKNGKEMQEQTKEMQEQEQDGEVCFSNFTEAKEWFCKKYNVSKTSVKNPTSLTKAAKEKGVTIKIG